MIVSHIINKDSNDSTWAITKFCAALQRNIKIGHLQLIMIWEVPTTCAQDCLDDVYRNMHDHSFVRSSLCASHSSQITANGQIHLLWLEYTGVFIGMNQMHCGVFSIALWNIHRTIMQSCLGNSFLTNRLTIERSIFMQSYLNRWWAYNSINIINQSTLSINSRSARLIK